MDYRLQYIGNLILIVGILGDKMIPNKQGGNSNDSWYQPSYIYSKQY